jgi:type IV pilus assembly protein PilN
MIKINLLKPEKKDLRETPALPTEEFKAKKAPPIGNLVFALILIILAALFFFQKNAITKEKKLLVAVQEEKQQLQYVVAKLDQLGKQKEAYLKKISLIADLKSQQDLAVRIMDELSRNLPEWVWLNEVTFDKMTVQIKGNAISNNLIADYIASLENSRTFQNVNLISSTQKTISNNQFLEFALSATCVLPVLETKPKEGAPQEVSKGGGK